MDVDCVPIVETLDLNEEEYDKYVGFKCVKIVKKHSKGKKKKSVPKEKEIKSNEIDLDKMDNWLNLGICEEVSKELIKEGFICPNELQITVLKDILNLKYNSFVASETGSGKTLLYAISIVNRCCILEKPNDKLRAIILSPTRELAIQIKNCVNRISKSLGIHCIDIIGGLSEIKQERLLNKKPEIIVGTPGRLWTYMNEKENEYFKDLSGLKVLVIDEIDRMTELGHFFQVKKIINFIKLKNNTYPTQVYSATLGVEKNKIKYNGKKKISNFNKISEFIGIDKFKIYDFTKKSITPSSLKEYKISCSVAQMYHILYYIVIKIKKCIIFVNTIKTADYLKIYLNNLNISAQTLHSRKQQKCRLKLYDKFKSTNSILIATDVAARGLDIPDIDTIIHFNVPIDPDTYIHRSGRTARFYKNGTSIIFTTPESFDSYKNIMKTLKREVDLEEYGIIYEELNKYKIISDLSKKVTDEVVKLMRIESKLKWFNSKSKECDIILDSNITDKIPDSDYIKELKNKIFDLKRNIKKLL